MMTSKAILNSEKKYTDDKMVFIDIYDKLEKLPTDEPNCDGVCVCRVPKSLSSVKPDAFRPQFVGLGPYHHFRAELAMTVELKLGVAKRVLKLKDLLPHNRDTLQQRLQKDVLHIQIHAFYHADVNTMCDYRTLLYLLTVDGLFLLGLLHSGAGSNLEEGNSYFLTGKQGMPLVNVAGAELTVDAIVRDVFMLENQIPLHVLKEMNGVNVNNMQIQQVDKDLGLAVLNFCERLCPLVHLGKLSKNPEAHDHLLDLMYHLIGEPEPNLFGFGSEFDFETDCLMDVVRWISGYPVILGWIMIWVFLYYVMLVQQLILWFLRPLLLKAIPWALGPTSGQFLKMPSLKYILSSAIAMLHAVLSHNKCRFLRLKHYRRIVGYLKVRTHRLLLPGDLTDSSDEAVTIPSATELRKTLISFKPAEGGISSVRFDEETGQFYLPRIRLDAISEVIITNLVAYESLTKSNDLIFTHYIELMSALIVTSEDVKLLAREKIIETQLSDEVVVQLFYGMMSKSFRRTKSPKLEEEIKKVTTLFDGIQKLDWFRTEYLRTSLMLLVAIAVLPLMAQLVQKIYCSSLFRRSNFCKQSGVGDYGKNNPFISSM